MLPPGHHENVQVVSLPAAPIVNQAGSEASPEPGPEPECVQVSQVSTGFVQVSPATAPIVNQADTDLELVRLWLHGRPATTQEAYRHDAGRFLAFIGGPLRSARLGELQNYADSLAGLKPASQARILASAKSLLSFGHRIGYMVVNVGAALRIPSRPDDLAQRILPEEVVLQLISGEPSPRNAALLRLLYISGLRVSEAASLRWKDVQPRGQDDGQITVVGKRSKVRSVRLTAKCWATLESIRGAAGPEDPVFRSQRGGKLDRVQLYRIVRAAAKRAGLKGLNVSPHWFRHAHASHALDRGAPVHLVQATLGHASMATTGKYSHARPSDSSGRYLPA